MRIFLSTGSMEVAGSLQWSATLAGLAKPHPASVSIINDAAFPRHWQLAKSSRIAHEQGSTGQYSADTTPRGCPVFVDRTTRDGQGNIGQYGHVLTMCWSSNALWRSCQRLPALHTGRRSDIFHR